MRLSKRDFIDVDAGNCSTQNPPLIDFVGYKVQRTKSPSPSPTDETTLTTLKRLLSNDDLLKELAKDEQLKQRIFSTLAKDKLSTLAKTNYVLHMMCDSGDEVVPWIYVSETSMTETQLEALRNSTRDSRADFDGTIPGIDPEADSEVDESVWVPVKKNDCDVSRLITQGTTEHIYAWY